MAEKDSISITKPCIEKCIKWFDKNYEKEEGILDYLIKKYPQNSDIYEVFIKVNAINTLYNAGLSNLLPRKNSCNFELCKKDLSETEKQSAVDIYIMSERIISNEKLDVWMKSSSKEDLIKAVYYIATGSEAVNIEYESPIKRYFSFASKYCAWHKPEIFPITDRFSRGMIYYSLRNGFNCKCVDKVTQRQLYSYVDYYDIYEKFQGFINEIMIKGGGEKLNKRQIDKYLWVYGMHNDISYD